jgi:hypothetical protein
VASCPLLNGEVMEVYIRAECSDVHAVSTIRTTGSADRQMKRIRDNH